MQGKIYKIVKILGWMNSRTVMMERFQDAEFSWHCCPQKTVTIPRSVCVLYLLFTQPSLIRSFHSSDPCFSVSCPKGVGYVRVYCSNYSHLSSACTRNLLLSLSSLFCHGIEDQFPHVCPLVLIFGTFGTTTS